MNIKDIKHRNDIKKFIATINDPTVCEVGTRNGGFFFDALYTPQCKLAVMVDIWQNTGDLNQNDSDYSQESLDSQYLEVFKKTSEYCNIKIIREFSHKACKFFEDNTFDFVYIDADHSYNGCLTDLRCWYPKVKSGGILAGHDFIAPELSIRMGHKTVFGVVPAVQKFLLENNLHNQLIHITPETYGTYFITKT